ncbi:PEP-CTERM sorting domain-containing protein [Desulfosediminicola flagellatus]|uniref:PEP-CTERM sorting domain-containing protein n=1 Tax=Desulfosediminicola flagellatus TaxID=2569541 RepID=UPI00142F25CB|nr:PEP-CTERM sorting domain-containing protein [Desulfosediminicola flagellatus]
MKNVMLVGGLLFLLAGSANALTLSFDYGGINWGTMDLNQADPDTLSVSFFTSATAPSGTQATGFAFAPYLGTFGVGNPLDTTFGDDQNDLNWIVLGNLNPIPNPQNSSLVKGDFTFGVTEGNSNNLNPPGIEVGDYDIFYLDFDADTSVSDITAVGVRFQSFSTIIDNQEVTSLFLVGRPPNEIPEPATMLLFGIGLTGLGFITRKRKF